MTKISQLKTINGVDVYYVHINGKKFALAQALGLQIARNCEASGQLGEYNEEEFAAFARKDIAERVLKGE